VNKINISLNTSISIRQTDRQTDKLFV